MSITDALKLFLRFFRTNSVPLEIHLPAEAPHTDGVEVIEARAAVDGAKARLSDLQNELGGLSEQIRLEGRNHEGLVGLPFPTPDDVAKEVTSKRQLERLAGQHAKLTEAIDEAQSTLKTAEKQLAAALLAQERAAFDADREDFEVYLRSVSEQFKRRAEEHAAWGAKRGWVDWVVRTNGDLADAVERLKNLDRAAGMQRLFDQMDRDRRARD